jgi:hypothetical protein
MTQSLIAPSTLPLLELVQIVMLQELEECLETVIYTMQSDLHMSLEYIVIHVTKSRMSISVSRLDMEND